MKKNERYRTILKTGIVLLLVILLFVTAFIIPAIQPIEGTPDTNISKVELSEDNSINEEIKGKTSNTTEFNELLDEHIKIKYEKSKDITENTLSEITEEPNSEIVIEDNNTNTDIEKIIEEKETKTETTRNNVQYATTELNFDTSGWVEMTMKITAYCPCAKCNGSYVGQPTASGTPLVVGRTIAVDPRVIPLGSYVVIDGHTYVAEDTGSGIKGNRIDLLFATHEEANEWGVRTKTVKVSQTRENLTEYINNLNNPQPIENTEVNIEEITETNDIIEETVNNEDSINTEITEKVTEEVIPENIENIDIENTDNTTDTTETNENPEETVEENPINNP